MPKYSIVLDDVVEHKLAEHELKMAQLAAAFKAVDIFMTESIDAREYEGRKRKAYC